MTTTTTTTTTICPLPREEIILQTTRTIHQNVRTSRPSELNLAVEPKANMDVGGETNNKLKNGISAKTMDYNSQNTYTLEATVGRSLTHHTINLPRQQ